MDDLIPFLIVIAISIIGGVARKNRKRDATQNITSTPQNKKSDDIFSWLEKFTDNEEPVSPYPQTASEENAEQTENKQHKPLTETIAQKAANKSNMVLDSEKKVFSNIEKNNLSKSTTPQRELTKTVEINEEEVKAKQQFNLKKAVIYSEILNRKYN